MAKPNKFSKKMTLSLFSGFVINEVTKSTVRKKKLTQLNDTRFFVRKKKILEARSSTISGTSSLIAIPVSLTLDKPYALACRFF